MVETRPAGCGLFGFGLFWLSLFFSPPSDCSSLPSTMTWAPCPHGVRTRGKKGPFHFFEVLEQQVTWAAYSFLQLRVGFTFSYLVA